MSRLRDLKEGRGSGTGAFNAERRAALSFSVMGACRAKTRAHSHCAAQTTDGLNPALGYFERSKRVSISNSFWAGGRETATNGFLNECKRVLGFAGLRLGCLRTELGGPYLIFSCC